MNRLYKISPIRRDPLIPLVWILSFMAIVAGLYVVSPFLDINAPSPSSFISQSTTSGVGLIALGGVWAGTGLAMMYGIQTDNYKWIARGLFVNFLVRVYVFIIGIVIYGLEYSWIPSSTLILIVFVMYLAVRRRV